MTPGAVRGVGVGLSLALLLLVPGCAQKTDWVEGTLVTVDVTGVWKGRSTTGSMTADMEMTLTQRGPKQAGFQRGVDTFAAATV